MNGSLRVVLAAVLGALAVGLLVAFVGYSHDQYSGATPIGSNLMGPAGAWIAHHVLGAWGAAGFAIPVLLLALALTLVRGDPDTDISRRLTGGVLFVPVLAGLLHLMPATRAGDHLLSRWDHGRLGGLGGSMGHFLCGSTRAPVEDPSFRGGLLVRHLDTGGSALVLAALAVGCATLMQVGLLGYGRRAWRAFTTYRPRTDHGSDQPVRRKTAQYAPPPTPSPQLSPAVVKARTTTAIKEIARIAHDERPAPNDAADLVERIRERRRALERLASGVADLPVEPVQHLAEPAHPATPAAPTPPPAKAAKAPAAKAAPAPTRDEDSGLPPGFVRPDPSQFAPMSPATDDGYGEASEDEDEDEEGGEEEVDGEEDDAEAAAGPPSRPLPARPPKAKVRRPLADANGYSLPPVDLLDLVPQRRETESENEKQATAKAIEEVFSHFAISVRVAAAARGPVITMYEIQLLDQAMRVNKVEGFEKDLSLKLGTEGIRIVAPLPNKKTIGIEVPNKVKEAVVMRDLVEQVDATAMTLPLILGRDVVGNPMMGDLAKMPHLLVAGATGTGKSVCMNAMICSVLLFRGPEEVKFIMVDPKMVELAGYEDIPHLLTPPITDMTKAHAALEWACRTMDERYFALRLVGVRDIKAYNELGEPDIRNRLARKNKTLEDIPGLQVRMPYIIILVDEYADLMMVNKEVEKSIIRLTQKSRAAGIHVILTTQRPSADVVTGLIKSNLPARICFRVADKSNSRVVLDAGGAENLLGRGDMLYLPPGSNTLVRGQGVWVKDKEIEAIIEHAKSQGVPQYDDTILSAGSVAMVGGGASGDGKSSEWITDRQFHEAVQAMYRYNRSGADFFRRKLNIGYNKATAYVEQLEDLGFLGPQKGTAMREIIKSWDDWIESLKGAGASWDEEDDIYHNPIEIRS